MKLKFSLLVSGFILLTLAHCTTTKRSKGASEELNSTSETTNVQSASGLMADPNLMMVEANCTGCHSAKLITMNRFTRDGWKDKIRWMQETQNLWDLGENEKVILDYLEKHYSPESKASRRKNLENIEWYSLDQ
ncbi:hypothetical protein [Jiulongibacter sp. NS-SX5]|uniref:hypothetical protein n=1 Tax=Jiulongibacter sp. NS-SX5 TaxID=3463854 RepID=UPI004058E29D